jgi:tetratricopeptide (TPR) repeat protein
VCRIDSRHFGAVEDWKSPLRLAEQASRGDPKNASFSRTLGALLYRADRMEEAIQELAKTTKLFEEPGADKVRSSAAYPWFFLAMAHQRLGQAEEGRKCLDEGIKAMEQEIQKKDIRWNRRLTLQLFRREAEALLGTTDEKTHHEDTKDPNKMP